MPLLFYAPFLLHVRTSKKHSDSFQLARLVDNLAAFVGGGSDHEMKLKTFMLRHFHMSKTPMFSFCGPPEVTSRLLPPDN